MIYLIWPVIILALIGLKFAKRRRERKESEAENAAKAEVFLLKLCGIDEKDGDAQ
jgi:hypothetical protein